MIKHLKHSFSLAGKSAYVQKDTKVMDMHCHILPYVDDGAENLQIALELLQMEAEQGVTELCLTPHLREGMFPTEDEKLLHYFGILQEAAKDIPIRLRLSREYFFDTAFEERLESRKLLPMGENTILVEFGYHDSFEEMADACEQVKAAGYRPVIAHPERYVELQEQPEAARRLTEMGALLQINSDGILGYEGAGAKRLCKYLLQNRLVFAVATDAHNPVYRPPRWGKCIQKLQKFCNQAYMEQILYNNPASVFDKEENR